MFHIFLLGRGWLWVVVLSFLKASKTIAGGGVGGKGEAVWDAGRPDLGIHGGPGFLGFRWRRPLRDCIAALLKGTLLRRRVRVGQMESE